MSRWPVRWPLAAAFGLGVLVTALLVWMLRPSEPAPAPSAYGSAAPPLPTRFQDTAPPAAQQPARYLGVVLAEETVDLAAEIDGTLDGVTVRVGDAVQRGQVIAQLDTASLDHQLTIERATLRTAQAEQRRQDIDAGRAQQELQRRLALEGLLSKEEEERARFQLESARATSEAAAAEVTRVQARLAQLETRLQRSAIRAPFEAVVSQRYLDPGTVVRPGTPIVRLISSGELIARFAVPPDEVGRLPVGTPVRIEVETLSQPLFGAVEHVAPEIDAASQHVFLEARLKAGEGVEVPPSGVGVWVLVDNS